MVVAMMKMGDGQAALMNSLVKKKGLKKKGLPKHKHMMPNMPPKGMGKMGM